MIHVLRPRLPSADSVAPYLVAIDETRIYSNYGPHVLALEDRLAVHFGLQDRMVTTVANATLGLTLALAAQDAAAGTLCLMPAWTFIASANAALGAGLVPYFVDVDPVTWALDPFAVADMIAAAPARVGGVMVVAPFGQAIDAAAWDDFRGKTGLPVVIDAAAGFDTLQVQSTPAVVSLHATKILGVGEGGFVASRDTSLIRSVRQRANFGFEGSRSARSIGLNAKLSEYHAAVGLAALDSWCETRAEWFSVARRYRQAFQHSNGIGLQPGFGANWVSSTCVISLDDGLRDKAQRALTAAGIETRLWWGSGAHHHPATAGFPRAALPATEMLARSTLGIPCHRDLSTDQIEDIACVLGQAIAAD